MRCPYYERAAPSKGAARVPEQTSKAYRQGNSDDFLIIHDLGETSYYQRKHYLLRDAVAEKLPHAAVQLV